jgi:hypothetical protein
VLEPDGFGGELVNAPVMGFGGRKVDKKSHILEGNN